MKLDQGGETFISTAQVEIDSITSKQDRMKPIVSIRYLGGMIGDEGLIVWRLPGGAVFCRVDEKIKFFCYKTTEKENTYHAVSSKLIEPADTSGEKTFYEPDTVEEEMQLGYTTNGYAWLYDKAITWNFNENCGDVADEEAEFEDATETWEAVSNTDINFVQGSDTAIEVFNTADGVHAVFWRYKYDVGGDDTYVALAQTYCWANGTITHFDMCFNTLYTWCNGATSGEYDIQGIATHELGHVLGLGHVTYGAYDSYTMYYDCDDNDITWRSLESGDTAGAQYTLPDEERPYVDIQGPVNGASFVWQEDVDIVADVASSDTVSEVKYRITSRDDLSYCGSWTTLSYSSGAWRGTWNTGNGLDGYYYLTVRAKTNNNVYGYDHIYVYVEEN